MCKNTEHIHYCTILSAEQWNFLLDGKSSVHRLRCLHRLMTDAVRTKTSYHIKGIQVVLEVGQAAASDVELSAYLDCNRKTVGKLIDSFNRLDMLTTRTNNRTSIHTLHFLTGWYVDGVLITNPHYAKPTANANGQNGDVRTPNLCKVQPDEMPPTVQSNRLSLTQEADSMEAEEALLSSSSLCSFVTSSQADNKTKADDYPLLTDLLMEEDNGISLDFEEDIAHREIMP